jgi:hypothetical protein
MFFLPQLQLAVGGQLHDSGSFNPGERVPGKNRMGVSVDPRTGMDELERRKISDRTGTRTPPHLSSSPEPGAIPTELS